MRQINHVFFKETALSVGVIHCSWTRSNQSFQSLLQVSQADTEIPQCAFSAMGFSGSLFIKSSEEQEYAQEVGPMAVLTGCGFLNTEQGAVPV